MVAKALERKHHDLYEPLCAIVGSKYVSDEDFALWAYSRDSSAWPANVPGIIVRPKTTEEVSEIMKLANKAKCSIFPRGGACTLYGTPKGEPGRSIVLDLTRMRKIIEINETNMTVTAECGIGLSELETELNRKGYSYNSIGFPYYCNTLGGTISGVGGGGYGQNMSLVHNWHFIYGFKVVLADGTIIVTSGPGTNINYKGNPFSRDWGPDLTGLFIADGGWFGVKTEATVGIFAKPKVAKGKCYLFDTFDSILKAQQKLAHSLSNVGYPYLCDWCLGLPPETADIIIGGVVGRKIGKYVTLLKFTGEEDDVDRRISKASKICEEEGGALGEDLQAGADSFATGDLVRNFGLIPAMGYMWAYIETFASSEQLEKVYLPNLKWSRKRSKELGLNPPDAVIFPMFFPMPGPAQYYQGLNIYYNPAVPGIEEKVLAYFREYFSRSTGMGCFPWCSSGISTNELARFWSPPVKEIFNKIKKMLDPNNILQPTYFTVEKEAI